MKSLITTCIITFLGICGTLTAQNCRYIPKFILQQPVETTQHIHICDGESYNIGSNLYTNSGCYINVFTAADGRDSIVTTLLNVREISETVLDIEICDGDFFMVGNEKYTRSGSYLNILTAASGCDSVVLTRLNVLEANHSSQIIELYRGDEYGGTEHYEDNESSTRHISYIGCDSVHTTIVRIINEFTEKGEISPDNPFRKVGLLPNPTEGLFTLEVELAEVGELHLAIYDLMGRHILSRMLPANDHISEVIDASGNAPGTYIVVLANEQSRRVEKLMLR